MSEAAAARRCLEGAIRAARFLPPRARAQVLGLLRRSVRLAEDPAVTTAAMRWEGGDRYALLVSPEFFRDRVASDEDALFVVLHELLHRSHGDLHLGLGGAMPAPVANLLCDMYVNSAACRLAFPRGPAILGRMYAGAAFPAQLLLPPAALARSAGCDPRDSAVLEQDLAAVEKSAADRIGALRLADSLTAAFRRLDAVEPRSAAELYAGVWLEQQPLHWAADRLLALLRTQFPNLELATLELELVGEHEATPGGPRLPGLELPRPRRTAGWAEMLERQTLLPDSAASRTRLGSRFFEAVLRALEYSPTRPVRRFGGAIERSVLPTSGRREWALLAGGWTPAFWPVTHDLLREADENAHVYVDVSGSMDEVQPLIYGLVAHSEGWIGNPVHLFSNRVVDVSLGELRAGMSESTGGTDFDCVIEHALAHRFRRILIATDGLAGLSEENERAARSARLHVVAVLAGIFTDVRALARLGATILPVGEQGPAPPPRDDDLPF